MKASLLDCCRPPCLAVFGHAVCCSWHRSAPRLSLATGVGAGGGWSSVGRSFEVGLENWEKVRSILWDSNTTAPAVETVPCELSGNF